jgi:hypothetical protein
MNKLSDLLKSVREGQASLLVDQLRIATKDGNDRVRIDWWSNDYGNNQQLTAAAKVVPVDPSLSIVALGVSISSADGNTIYVSGYSAAEFSVKGSALWSIATTTLFNPAVNGRDAIAVVSGEVQAENGDAQGFSFEKKVTF